MRQGVVGIKRWSQPTITEFDIICFKYVPLESVLQRPSQLDHVHRVVAEGESGG